MPALLSNPRYWELRAEEARVIAQDMKDPEARRMMIGVADTFDLLARRFAEIEAQLKVANQKKPPETS